MNRMRRRGFTIIELLVVIGILALLMGLTLGGIAGMKKTDRLLVTEHLVGDVIRQARHTARTSGTPVLVSISNDTDGHGWISGISRIPIWSESFDGFPANAPGITTGLVGHGCKTNSTDPSPSHALADGMKIVRGGRADGFYITCQVLPPLISAGGGVIPLVVIAPPPSGSVTSAEEVSSLCGLALTRVSRLEQTLDSFKAGPPKQRDDQPLPAELPNLVTWEIVGWINDTSEPDPLKVMKTVSSIATADRPRDVARDELVLHDSVDDGDPATDIDMDVAWPMAGGRWEEVGLLYDGPGRRLVLYRNGVRVGETTLTRTPRLASGDEVITVGELYQGSGPIFSGEAIIDEVAVHRLAAAEPRRLPGDIKPDRDYRIIAQPDGRVEVDGAATAPAPAVTVMTFSGAFNQAGKAEISVTIDGRVSGKITP